MGAVFNYTQWPGDLNSSQLHERFAEMCDDAAWESGHGGYTGTWAECRGLSIRAPTFETTQEAADWLTDNAQKWEEALAVKAKDKAGNEVWAIGAWCSS